MSLIGTLEQFSLTNVLQRSESHGKTGLLIIKQGTQWIEFYLQEGRLLCIGPMRTNATLGERLLQDGLISATVLNETLLVLRDTGVSESRIARTLIELGYVSREELRAWVINSTVDVLKVLLTWTAGEIYFQESTPPPGDRLLVSMSVSSLLESVQQALPMTPPPAATPAVSPQFEPSSPAMAAAPSVEPMRPTMLVPSVQSSMPESSAQQPSEEPLTPSTPSPDVARVPTLMNASQFLDESAFSLSGLENASLSTDSLESVISESEESQSDSGFLSLFGDDTDDGVQGGAPALSATIVTNPIPPKRIDVSFMHPEMVLLPMDVSAYREQNPYVQITPDQWCVLTYVDGQTPLAAICQALSAAPDLVCQVAGELIAEGLVMPTMPNADSSIEPSPVVREVAASGLGNGYVAPGYASAAASPWSASLPAMPATSNGMPMPPQASTNPMATESQWGNGGNGATFIPGRGWITTPQPLQPLSSTGSLPSASGIYMTDPNNF